MTTILTLLIFAALLSTLIYRGWGYWSWVSTAGAALGLWLVTGVSSWVLFSVCAAFLALAALVFGAPALRRSLFSSRLMRILSRVMPTMSETERIALEAGTVWWDAELFSGSPRWEKLLEFPLATLDEREQRFLDGPVEELCTMLDDWQIRQDADLPPEVWDFIKAERFFGMIIPEEHGGLGFSALAHSAVVTKISSRSVTAAVTVMVPNSLGPAELLLHYGTEEQQNTLLPRLATGEEVPCFALTEPGAGSDAASMTSSGVLCRGKYQGAETLGIRLNWEKRYITLAPVATLVGLAFQLRDPDHLLGEVEEYGITCALIPVDTPGVEVGQRHDPLGVPFLNGPTTGRDVFVPLDCIIGGRENAGAGWRMLMQSLAAGRGISLPSLSCGAAQLVSRTTSAYAAVREQFNVAIGRFEGIEERLARIAGLTYLMNAARELTASAVDAGEKPAVISAIVKAYLTEMMRVVVNDGMDVQAGAAICRGPRNILSGPYQSVPVGITVEGANILTRSLIIYGQGALRCHPHVREQVEAIADQDLPRFDRAIFAHAGFVARNLTRAFLIGLSGARLGPTPVGGELAGYFRRLNHLSAAFVTLSDVAMGVLGGSLKRREKLSGRFADAFAWMYLSSATLRQACDAGHRPEDLPFVRWACDRAAWEIQEALVAILDNFPVRPVAILLRRALFPWGARLLPPSDRLGAEVVRTLLEDVEARDRLTADIYRPRSDEPGLGLLETAFEAVREASGVERKIKEAVRQGKLDRKPRRTIHQRACDASVISESELRQIERARDLREAAVQVDAFDSQCSSTAQGQAVPRH